MGEPAKLCVVGGCVASVRPDNLAYCHQHMLEAELRGAALLAMRDYLPEPIAPDPAA